MNIKLPTIHLNGTSKDSLMRGYESALKAIRHTLDEMDKIELNARDYYTQGPEAYREAREQFNEQYNSLCSVKEYLECVAYGIARGGHEVVEQEQEPFFPTRYLKYD